MSGFDEKCPLCGTNQGDLRAAWEAKEYPGEFQCQCDKCDRWIADTCVVSNHLVSEVRAEIKPPICWKRSELLAAGKRARREKAGGGCMNLQDSLAAGWLRVMKQTLRPARGSFPKVNPRFWDRMMGFPIGWTQLEPLAMPKFQQWLEQHGVC